MNVLFFLIGAQHWLQVVIYVGKWYSVIVMSGMQLGSGQRMVFAVLAIPCCHICGNFDKFKQYYVTYTIINFGILIGNVQTSVLAVMLKLAGPCCHKNFFSWCGPSVARRHPTSHPPQVRARWRNRIGAPRRSHKLVRNVNEDGTGEDWVFLWWWDRRSKKPRPYALPIACLSRHNRRCSSSPHL